MPSAKLCVRPAMNALLRTGRSTKAPKAPEIDWNLHNATQGGIQTRSDVIPSGLSHDQTRKPTPRSLQMSL